MWVPDNLESQACPRCLRRSRIPENFTIAGLAVEVKRIELFGDEYGLCDPEVRRGMDKARLGCKCPHGYIADSICPECSEQPIRFYSLK